MRKKYLKILQIFLIGVFLIGCSNKNIHQDSETSKQSEQIKQVNTLAVDSDYVTYNVVASNYFSNYLPENVLDDDSLTSWVLSDDKFGNEEWIKIKFSNTIKIDKLYVLNGLGDLEDQEEAYHNDNRVKTLELEFSNGEKQTINLKDDCLKEQEIVLEKAVSTEYVKFTIKDIYEGEKFPKLTCISSIGINYPRINGNDDETTCFNGIYEMYDKKNKKSNVIKKYIDFKDGLEVQKKIQYIANLLVDKYYEDSSIEVKEVKSNSANIDLVGDTLSNIYESKSDNDIINRFFIESNLIQYYYEGNDYLDEIKFNNVEDLEINKKYIKNTYLDDENIDKILNKKENSNKKTVKNNINYLGNWQSRTYHEGETRDLTWYYITDIEIINIEGNQVTMTYSIYREDLDGEIGFGHENYYEVKNAVLKNNTIYFDYYYQSPIYEDLDANPQNIDCTGQIKFKNSNNAIINTEVVSDKTPVNETAVNNNDTLIKQN